MIALVTHYVYLLSMMSAISVKVVEWRGIKYYLRRTSEMSPCNSIDHSNQLCLRQTLCCFSLAAC